MIRIGHLLAGDYTGGDPCLEELLTDNGVSGSDLEGYIDDRCDSQAARLGFPASSSSHKGPEIVRDHQNGPGSLPRVQIPCWLPPRDHVRRSEVRCSKRESLTHRLEQGTAASHQLCQPTTSISGERRDPRTQRSRRTTYITSETNGDVYVCHISQCDIWGNACRGRCSERTNNMTEAELGRMRHLTEAALTIFAPIPKTRPRVLWRR